MNSQLRFQGAEFHILFFFLYSLSLSSSCNWTEQTSYYAIYLTDTCDTPVLSRTLCGSKAHCYRNQKRCPSNGFGSPNLSSPFSNAFTSRLVCTCVIQSIEFLTCNTMTIPRRAWASIAYLRDSVGIYRVGLKLIHQTVYQNQLWIAHCNIGARSFNLVGENIHPVFYIAAVDLWVSILDIYSIKRNFFFSNALQPEGSSGSVNAAAVTGGERRPTRKCRTL